jgi:hypothetical protein
MDALFTTEPHGEHAVTLLEDAAQPENRIYEIAHRHEDGAVRVLGSELASLLGWWATEKNRPGKDEEGD